MNSRREMAAEVLVSAGCALMAAALVAGYLLFSLTAGATKGEENQGEPAPYSVCEFCGQVLDGTNDVCAAEGRAEGGGE